MIRLRYTREGLLHTVDEGTPAAADLPATPTDTAAAAGSTALGSPPHDDAAELINRWAFAAETLLHGKPSGLDNTVSCFGSAVQYRRSPDASPDAAAPSSNPPPLSAGGFSRVAGFPGLRVLLSNTRVPRETRALVGHVKGLTERLPGPTSALMDALEAISEEFIARVGEGAENPLDLQATGELMSMAHALLGGLGVGHPELDRICQETARWGYSTKLTGAGKRSTTVHDEVSTARSEVKALTNEPRVKPMWQVVAGVP